MITRRSWLGSVVDGCVISGEVGVRKPDRRIFGWPTALGEPQAQFDDAAKAVDHVLGPDRWNAVI